MKVKISSFCWQCYRDKYLDVANDENLAKEKRLYPEILVDLNDNHIYEYVCPSGHKTITRFQEQKFEILFDLATLALLDGYTKEAISTYASTLERFYEFYILAISLKNSISLETYQKMWKCMAKQSERQLGAFLLLQLLEGEDMALIYNEKQVELRNAVIHKGYIPKTEETINYGEYVLSIIHTTLKKLNESMPDFFAQCTFAVYKINSSKIPKNVEMIYQGLPTLVGLNKIKSKEFGQLTLREILSDSSKYGFLRNVYFKGL